MKKILIHSPAFAEGKLFNPDERDCVLEPFIYLRDRVNQLGYQLETADNKSVEDCSWIWFRDFSEKYETENPLLRVIRSLKRVLKRKGQHIKKRNHYEDCMRAGYSQPFLVKTDPHEDMRAACRAAAGPPTQRLRP